MPAYDYVCKTCGLEFEEILPISQREEPITSPSKYCQQIEAQCEIEIKVASPFIGDPMRMGRKKPDRAFNDKLRELKKAHHGNNIKVYD
jgi:putative FmdB family regulatory protein